MNARRFLVALTVVGLCAAALFLPLWAWKKNQVRVDTESGYLVESITGMPQHHVSDPSVVFLGLGLAGAVLGGVSGLVVLTGATGDKVRTATDPLVAEAGTRPCPFCAEQIKEAAVVCRFCGREVDLHIPES